MTIVSIKSLDMSNRPLSLKRKACLAFLKSGQGYNSFILKQNGDLIRYSLDSRVKSGISVKTLKPENFRIY